MKRTVWMLFLGILLLAACEYDVPLTMEHSIPIDQGILGTWEADSGEDDYFQLRILKFSDTEYLVHDAEDDGDLYFRAYAIEVAGISAVQLEFLGDDDNPVKSDGGDRYFVASYKMVDGMLEIRTLNTELVNDELTDSESLRAAFIANKDNPELFNNPGFFRRVTD